MRRNPEDNPAYQALLRATAEKGQAPARAAVEPAPAADQGESLLLLEFNRGPRNDPRADVVRWSIDTFRPPDDPDKPRKYISARRWFRARDGSYRPTREGITIRVGELVAIVKALVGVARDLGVLPAKEGGSHGA